MNRLNNVLWGIVLILAGLAVSINILGIVDFDLMFKGWWTLFIIIPTAINLITDKNKKTSLLGFFVGIILLLDCQGILDSNVIWKLIIPVVAIVYGITLIKRSFPKENKAEEDKI